MHFYNFNISLLHVVKQPGDTKIKKFKDFAFSVYHDVVRFEVGVDDFKVVEESNRSGQLDEVPPDLPFFHV